MLETLRLMRRQHFKTAEKHHRLQADKKTEESDSKARSEAERPNPQKRDFPRAFASLELCFTTLQSVVSSCTGLVTSWQCCIYCIALLCHCYSSVTASPAPPWSPQGQQDRAVFYRGYSLFQSWGCRSDRSVGSACISYSTTFKAEIQFHFQSFNQQFTETPDTFWLQLPINLRNGRAWLC